MIEEGVQELQNTETGKQKTEYRIQEVHLLRKGFLEKMMLHGDKLQFGDPNSDSCILFSVFRILQLLNSCNS
jgi:hypothetical protein